MKNPSSLRSVVEDYGLKTVQEYMYHIRNNAENCVRNLLRDVVKKLGTNTLSAIDYLDDGSPVCSPLSHAAAEVHTRRWNHRSVFEWR